MLREFVDIPEVVVETMPSEDALHSETVKRGRENARVQKHHCGILKCTATLCQKQMST